MYSSFYRKFLVALFVNFFVFRAFSQDGSDDQKLSVEFITNPEYILIPSMDDDPLNSRKFRLNEFGPQLFEALNEEELKKFLKVLSNISIKIKWQFKNGQSERECCPKNRWKKTNAAAAIAVFMGASGHKKIFSKMIALAPDAIIPLIQGELAVFMDAEVAATSLIDLILQIESNNTSQIAKEAANITKVYTEYWYDEDDHEHSLVLTNLVFEISRIIGEMQYSIKQKGILLGSILAGSLLHAEKIKSKDENQLWMVNSISNLAWATTSLLGLIPVAGTISTSLSGIISISVVVWAVISGKGHVRDISPKIREIEGYLELAVLDITQNYKEARLDILELLAWVHASIHVNGLTD